MGPKTVARLLAVVAALSLAACGSSSSSSSGSASSTSTASNAAATTPASKSTILIGLVTPGAGSPVFDTQAVAADDEAFIRAINAQGGLGGHPLKLDYCNDKNDPNQTITCAQKMVSDHVVMLAGGNLLNGAQLATIMNKAGIPEVGLNVFTGTELNSPNMFLLTSTAPGYVVMAGYLAHHGLSTAMLGADNATALQLYDIVSGASAALHKPWLSKTLVPTTVPDMSPYVQAALKDHPQVIQSFLGIPQEYQAVALVGKLAPTVKWATAGGPSSAAAAKATGEAPNINNVMAFGNLLPLQETSNPVVSRFLSEVNSYYAATHDTYATPLQTSFVGFSGWLGLYALQQLAKTGQLSADNMSSATVMKAFQTAKNINMGGVVPPWTPNAPGPKGEVRISNPYYYIWTYSNGGASVKLLTPHPVSAQQALAGQF